MAQTRLLKPIPSLPDDFGDQPAVVAALDKVRFAREQTDSDGTDLEFYWFAREYTRIYRYHLYHAENRLTQMHRLYEKCAVAFRQKLELAENIDNLISMSEGRLNGWPIYWNFEDFLGAINSALDTLARVSTLFYSKHVPISFNKLAAKRELLGPAELFRQAQVRWVLKMKDYRDCFVHFTPVDNESYIDCVRDGTDWSLWCRLPLNPNVRETEGFRYSRRTELLKYALYTYRNVRALDRKLGNAILAEWKAERFPARVSNLFFVAPRMRDRQDIC